MVDMYEQSEAVLRAYLHRTLGVREDTWSIRRSDIKGRGMFATRDLNPGDLIFHDRPVVWGPRAKTDNPMCAACNRIGRVSNCAAGCYLPVCSPECSTSPHHVRECKIIRDSMNLQEGEWRLNLLATLTPLRCLLLGPEDREVVQCLQGNQGKVHGIEVDCLKEYMQNNLSEEDEAWMRQCCLAMDTNAFEFLKVLSDGSQTSLRGLYPLAAILNHACSPNTCHVYDSEGIMRVFAARPVAAGDEITTSYSALLWSTTIRRLNLAKTKHFLCRCDRCADPTEFGSMLSGLPCTGSGCCGILLPANPLKINSNWFCDSCATEVSPKEAAQMQAVQGSVLQRLGSADPPTVAQFIKEQLLPGQCQLVVQLKTNLVWELGHITGFALNELSQEMLDFKEKCCRDILLLLDMLRCGFCRMKGLILLELHGALCEQHRRSTLSGLPRQGIEAETRETLATGSLILQHDAAAQKKLSLRIQDQLQISSSTP